MKKLRTRLISLTLALAMLIPASGTIASAATNPSSALSEMQTMASTLESLISTCKAQGIACDYEEAALSTINIFIDFLEEDIANSDTGRVDNTLSTTQEIYNEAKANLDAYKAGTKKPFQVPKYQTSDVTVDGHSLIATTKWPDGTVEKRPVFFIGYGHGTQAGDLLPKHYGMGLNSAQLESGPNRLVKEEFGWAPNKIGGFTGNYEIANNAGVDGTKALHITCDYTANVPNVYMVMDQYVTLTEGKTYVISAKTKGKAGYVGVAVNQFAPTWESQNFTTSADWTDYKLEFTPKAGSGTSSVKITLYVNYNVDLYIDNLTLCEKGTTTNLLVNSGFEASNEAKDLRFDENQERVVELKNYLQSAEDNNTTVDLLLSPHNFDQSIITQYDMAMDNGFLKYNPFHPVAKEIVEKYLRGILNVAKRYDSVKTINLTNEPSFNAIDDEDFFLADWQAFLEKTYGTITALNSAYGQSYTSFDQVDMQGYNDITAKKYDYMLFNDSLGTAWHKWLYDIVKDVWPEIPVGTKVSGYLSTNRNSGFSNGMNFGKLAEFMEINGYDYSNYYNWDFGSESSFWQDYMMSIKDAPLANYEDHIIADYDTDLNATKDEHTYTNLLQGAIHGRAISDIWNWNRNATDGNYARYLHAYRPDVVYKTSKANLDANRLAEEIVALSNKKADVGIFVTDASFLLDQTAMHAVYEAYDSAKINGAKVKFFTDSNYADMGEVKLMIIPNQKYVPAKMLTALSNYKNNGGKIFILGTDSLIFNERGGASNSTEKANIVSGATQYEYVGGLDDSQIHNKDVMTSPSKANLTSYIRTALTNAGLCNVTATISNYRGETNKVEMNTVEYRGDLLVNLVNYSTMSYFSDKTVTLYVDGQQVTSAVDLITGEQKVSNGQITLKKFEPVILKIDRNYTDYDFTYESNKPDSWTIDWGYYAMPDKGDESVITSQVKKSGDYSLYLNQENDSKKAEELTISSNSNVSLDAGNYNLTFWAKSDWIDGLTFKVGGGKTIAKFSEGMPEAVAGGYQATGTVSSTSGEWTKYNIAFTADEAANGKFSIYSDDTLINVFLDEMVLTKSGSSTNLLTDGGFEDVTKQSMKTGRYAFNSWLQVAVNVPAEFSNKAFVEPADGEFCSDEGSAHFVWPFGENFDNRYIRFRIPGTFAQGKYKVSLAIKNKGRDLGITPRFEFKGSMNLATAATENLGNGWVKYTADVTTTGAASFFEIHLSNGYTDLYVDNLEVYAYDSNGNVGTANLISDPGFTNVTGYNGTPVFEMKTSSGTYEATSTLKTGELRVTQDFKNICRGDNFKVAMILAIYKDGRYYTSVKSEEVTIPEDANSTTSVSATINVPELDDGVYTLKVMTWSGMSPFDKAHILGE